MWLLLSLLFSSAAALQAGTSKTNDVLPLPIKVNGVVQNTFVALDANWRWWHNTGGYSNCFQDPQGWVSTYCPDVATCTKNCVIEGVPLSDWTSIYGATVSGNALTLKYVTGPNIGTRNYLLDSSKKSYFKFAPVNQEFTFTVDVSKLPCGLNGALYFVEMAPLGGRGDIDSSYGVNYGDAQCPVDIKYISGFANMNGTGACSHEMDIWEANSQSTQFTPHTCSFSGVKACTNAKDCGQGSERYNGFCDKDGADYNPYRVGNKQLYGYGAGFAVDTSKPLTVITQFIANGAGDLTRIQRYYKQGGKVVDGGFLDDASIASRKKLFGEVNHFATLGGLKGMGNSLKRGHVLTLSIWDDSSPAQMLWLDGVYPKGSSQPGAARGPCPSTGQDPATLRAKFPSSAVIYSDIRIDPIGTNNVTGSTPTPTPVPSPTPTPTPVPVPSPPTPTPAPTNCAGAYQQCGGKGFTGSTCCVSGYSCQYNNDYYSQCLPGSVPTPTPSPNPPSPTPAPTPTPSPNPPSPTPTPSGGPWTCYVCTAQN